MKAETILKHVSDQEHQYTVSKPYVSQSQESSTLFTRKTIFQGKIKKLSQPYSSFYCSKIAYILMRNTPSCYTRAVDIPVCSEGCQNHVRLYSHTSSANKKKNDSVQYKDHHNRLFNYRVQKHKTKQSTACPRLNQWGLVVR